jgi:hypothetical protein
LQRVEGTRSFHGPEWTHTHLSDALFVLPSFAFPLVGDPSALDASLDGGWLFADLAARRFPPSLPSMFVPGFSRDLRPAGVVLI